MSDYSIKKIRKEFKEKGIFYTPPELAEFIKNLIDVPYSSIYDPTCGHGNLLSLAGDDIKKYGQDVEQQAIDYCNKNIINFTGYMGDTLTDDKFKGFKFDLIVANPPFSIKWAEDKIDKDNDIRFKDAPCLAPASKADWAFMCHIIEKLKDNGQAIVIEFPGILYRGQRELKIRQWFVDNNWIDTVILIPGNTFTDTAILTVCLILRKNKKDTKIKFVDKEKGIEYIATQEEIKENNYNLSVSSYCVKEEKKEKIDAWELEKLCRTQTINFIKSNIELSKIVAELEGWGFEDFIKDIIKVVKGEYVPSKIIDSSIEVEDVGKLRQKQFEFIRSKLFEFGGSENANIR